MYAIFIIEFLFIALLAKKEAIFKPTTSAVVFDIVKNV